MGSKVPPITPTRLRPLINRHLLSSRYRDGIGLGGPKMFRLIPWGYAHGTMRWCPHRGYHRDMTSVPDRARVRLTGISSRAYEHPADRSALVALRKLTGFDTLLKLLNGLLNERAMRLNFLASGVKVSDRQFPHIHEMLRDGAYVLDMDKVPELFIAQTPLVNAMALGTNTPFIVLNSGLVDLLDAEELRAVIGHELGHVLSGHAVSRTMLYNLILLAQRIAWMPIGYLGLRAIIWGLEEWYRKSELSCDRAGLLAGQDIDASRRALMKTAGGARLRERKSEP